MNEDIVAQFKVEGQPAFPTEDTENDNSADSPSGEKTNIDQTQSQEGGQNSGGKQDDDEGKDKSRGFADDPRWIEREKDWKERFNTQEQRHTEELQQLREEFMGKSNKNDITPEDIPSWFGGDADQWKEFCDYNGKLIKEAQEGAIKMITSKSEEDQKRIDEATKYFQDTVTEIESDKSVNPQGEKIDRNKLLKFVLDNDLVDSQGRWNYRAGFLMMKGSAINNSNIQDKKKIAGASMGGNKADAKQPNITTSEDFKKPGSRPW